MSRLNLDTTVGGNQRYSFMETPVEMHPSFQRNLSNPPAEPNAPPHPVEEPERQRAWSYASEKEQQFQNQGIIPDYANCPPIEQHPANYAPLARNQQQQQQPQHNTMSPQTYAIAPEQHPTQLYTQSYTQSYTNIAEQSRTMTPQAYVNQSHTNIPEQQQQWHQQIGMTISPQYANVPQQDSTPMSPQTYATHSYATQSYTHIQDQQRDIEPPIQQYASYPETPSSPPPISPGPLPLKVNPEAPARSETMPIVPDENPLQSPKSPYFPPPTRAATSRTPQPDDLSAYHQPGQSMHPNQETKGGGWSNGLCEFSNFGICCLGMLCPCILYGRTQHRLSMKSRKEDPTNMLGYETCNASCTGMGLLCGCQWLLATIQHTRTRKAYGIQGSIMSDCVRATCCTCCTLIQDEKEIQKREEYRSRVARERGAALLSPYTTPGPMSYSPPPR
ncbi:hypothetical protein N7517_010744 [Penicillium concentricum]|uniref:DUF614 domain protein n=1 Tax=Penicillium concentricum TaxID=293559 RepID=A0A9W9R9E2_9EURO|nr:uncharacterized protein N7517_010744 [Penicillium concentricum]KAJ5356135.1 hypothetical protein N7517_010744 [Penicillium concentricum]